MEHLLLAIEDVVHASIEMTCETAQVIEWRDEHLEQVGQVALALFQHLDEWIFDSLLDGPLASIECQPADELICHESPPAHDVCVAGTRLCLYLLHSKLDGRVDGALPILSQLYQGKAFSIQLPPLTMLSLVSKIEDVIDGTWRKKPVERRFREVGAHPIDVSGSHWICNVDLFWRDAHDWTILLMERVDVVNAVASKDRVSEASVREFGIPRTGNL